MFEYSSILKSVALPRGAMGLSAVCDCGISWSYSLTIYEDFVDIFRGHHKIGLYLGSFLKVKVQNGGIFWGC